MAKPNIEVNLEQKTISTDGRSLRLGDNFEGAGIFVIGGKGEISLELNYRKRQQFCENDESEKIYNFFQNSHNDKLKKLEIWAYREVDFNRAVFPAVAITGEFNYNISN